MTNEMSEAIFAAWAARVEGGEELEFAELLREHPTHTDELTKLHADWKLFAPLLGKVVPGLIGSDGDIVVKPLSSGGDDESAMPTDELVDRLGIKASNSGRYRFRSVLGKGGGGVVLKVWDTKLSRPLAMKVVLGRDERGRPSGDTPRVDSQRLTRFVDEARIASQLNHPGIVPVHELGADEMGRAYFTMKLVKGDDLSVVFEHVKTGKDDWNQTRALNVLQRVCEAMAFAHDKGVVHRDLKPANIMVGKFGEVYVMDWGLARVMGEEDHVDLRVKLPSSANASVLDSLRAAEPDGSPLLTVGGQALGTPAYMSPEQARGDVEAIGVRSDVYAIGAMLYELVAGRMPYVDPAVPVGPATMVDLVKRGPPEPLTKLAPRAPAELIAIAEKAMERDPAKRYANTQVLGADLRAFLEGHVVAAYETGTWAETRKWVRRNKPLAGALAASLVIAIGGALAFASKYRESSEKEIKLHEATIAATSAAADAREAQRDAEAKTEEAQRRYYMAAIMAASSAQMNDEPHTLRRLLDAAPPMLRHWEWGYLNSRLVRLGDGVGTLDPDGSLVVTAHLGDVAQGKRFNGKYQLEPLKGHELPLSSACFSPDGTRVLTAAHDKTVRLWDAAMGSELARLEGHTAAVNCAVFAPNGLQIATVSEDGTLREWNAMSGKETGTARMKSGAAAWIAYSPDGKTLVTAHAQGIVQLWNSHALSPLISLNGHTGDVKCATFSPDGTRVVTGSTDKTARIWDARTGENTICLSDHKGMVLFAAFDPSGTHVATASEDGYVRIWDAQSGAIARKLEGHHGRVSAVGFSPDGKRLVTGSLDGTARVWDTDSGETLVRLTGHTKGIRSVVFSSDGSRILTSSDDRTARIWDSVSIVERADEWEELDNATLEAEQILGSLFAGTKDADVVAKKLLCDAHVSNPVRHVALNMLTQRSNVQVLKAQIAQPARESNGAAADDNR